MRSNYKKLGDYIRPVDDRNSDLSVTNLQGVSITKEFVPSIANIIGTDLSKYKIVRTGQFAYGPVTSRNGEKVSIALLKDKDCIISSSYSPFEIYKTNELLPEYLMLWFMRSEFDRYARFMSNGSAREVFDWDSMCAVEIPVPPLAEQHKIVWDYQVITDRIGLLQKLIDKLEEYTKTIYKSFFETFDMFSGVCPETISTTKISSLPIEVTDFVANGSFADLRNNVTLYDEENYAYYVRNTDLKNNCYSKYVDEQSYQFLSKSFLAGGEVIISNVADVGSVFLCPHLDKPMTLGSNVIMLRSSHNQWSYFMYLYFKFFMGKRQIVEITTGSAQPKFNKTAFRGIEGLFPAQSVLEEFNNKVRPVFDQMDRCSAEMRVLKALSKAHIGSMSFKGA